MREYELMVLLDPSIDVTKDKERDTLVAKLLGSYAKNIKETTTMGKKRLAYEINKQNEAVYVLVKLQGEPIAAADVAKQSKLINGILRYQLISVN